MSEQRNYINRERFQSLPKPPTESVYIEGWDAWVLVKGLSAGVAIDMIALSDSDRPEDVMKVPGLIARIVIDSVVGEDGKRVFKSSDLEEIDNRPLDDLMPIVMAAVERTNIGSNSVGEAEKNSGTGQSAGSSSA